MSKRPTSHSSVCRSIGPRSSSITGPRSSFPTLYLAAGAFSSAQVHALASLPLETRIVTYSVSAVFFGCYGVIASRVIYRSNILPRPVGVLMVIAGCSYLTCSFATFVAPTLAAGLVPYIRLPSLVGEASLCVCLLAGRIDVGRWRDASRAGLWGRWSTRIGTSKPGTRQETSSWRSAATAGRKHAVGRVQQNPEREL